MSRNVKPSLVGEIVLQYLERFPKIPALTLAKKIYAENSTVFKNIEHARSRVRYYLGQNGSENRGYISNKKFIREARDTNPFALPDFEEDTWNPVHIPSIYNKGLIINDLHYPYTDKRAFETVINWTLKYKNINFIFINGDGMDFYQASKFNKDIRNRSISDEYWGWVELLNSLQYNFPNVKIIYWKLGNHEERMENYLRVKAPELLDMEEFHPGNIIKIRGVENVEVIEKQIAYIGRNPMVHGHEFSVKNSNPVNPARGLMLKTLSSATVAHHHQTSSHSDTDINGKLMSWRSVGCLCLLHPEWALLNKWNHGFAYIETEGQDFIFENMKIYQGDKVYRD